jgi:hypothetical protein
MNQEDEAQLDDELREEYDEQALKHGVRGKYAQRLAHVAPTPRMARRRGGRHSQPDNLRPG